MRSNMIFINTVCTYFQQIMVGERSVKINITIELQNPKQIKLKSIITVDINNEN